MKAASRISPAPAADGHRLLARILYGLATIQVVWAYHARLQPYLHLLRYENGTDITPCQTRILMMLLLRWAHHNPFLIGLANLLSRFTPIYRSHIGPESLVFAVTDTAGIVVAGWVATRIYEAASERRLLTPYIYPLVLVFCVAQYVLVALHPYRFYYDLPSLGFFAVGLYLIYFRKHPLLFAALFVVATVNRETTLLLLFFFVLAAVTRGGTVDWRRSYAPRTLAVVLPLAMFWEAWRIIVTRMYAHNHFASIPASKINVALLLWPPAWPQMLAGGCYTVLPILVCRKLVRDRTLRIWLWTLPAWFAIMFRYAIIDEPRLYGELIPYLACMAAIVMEQAILARLEKDRRFRVSDSARTLKAREEARETSALIGDGPRVLAEETSAMQGVEEYEPMSKAVATQSVHFGGATQKE